MHSKILKQISTAIVFAMFAMTAYIAHAESPFEIYGFGQMDYIQDMNRVNPTWDSTLRPSRIPTTAGTFGSDGQAILSARQSRLGVQSTLPTDAGDVYTKFEFDLFGVGVDEGQTTIRLRHAYGKFGHILAGQTNSTFMDVDIFPNVIDYWGPTGMVFFRNPQLRWEQGGNTSFAVAIEHPTDDVDTGKIREFDSALGSSIKSDEKVPDLTANIRQKGNWGHVQAAGILRRIGYDTPGTVDASPKGSVTGWGIDLTSVINVRKKDQLKLGVVVGDGIASYMNDGGMDVAPTGSTTTASTNISAKAVPLVGVSAYYDVYWSEKFSSSVGYSVTQVENTDFQAGNAYHSGTYASANLIYYPTKNVFYGVEYLYGRRQDHDGNTGDDQRVQLSAHYGFSSKDHSNN